MTDLGWLWPLAAAPFIGSFMGVLIARLPSGQPVALSRSACPHCATTLTARDMVPLVSFLVLRGRCRHCGEAIGWFHPGVELAATAVAACAFALDPDRAWIGCGLGWTLLTLSWIDWRSFLLPDVLTLPLLLSGLVICALDDPDDLTDHAIACVFGYGSFQALGWAYRRLRGRDGLGGGDAKLIAAAGAWCGLAALPFVIFLSAVAGLLAALGLALSGRSVTSTTRIPFGPCIALAFWLVWLDPLFGGP
jgi:leader peptidase (prepilin peptidase)/N-methyltransferase